MKVSLTINKKKKKLDVPANRTLMDLLRSQGLWSIKHGCETGDCGNCTVNVDGQAVYSCLMLAVQAEGKSVETFESISDAQEYQFLKETLMDFYEIDCGYCIPGFMMSLKALLNAIPDPMEEEVVDALAGNVCRCAKNIMPLQAIMESIKKMRGKW